MWAFRFLDALSVFQLKWSCLSTGGDHQCVSAELLPLPAGLGTHLLGKETRGRRCCPAQTNCCSCPLGSARSPADRRSGSFQQHLPRLAELGWAKSPRAGAVHAVHATAAAAPTAEGMAWTAGGAERDHAATAISSGFGRVLLLSRPKWGMRHCEGRGGTPRFFEGLDSHQVYISLQAQGFFACASHEPILGCASGTVLTCSWICACCHC